MKGPFGRPSASTSIALMPCSFLKRAMPIGVLCKAEELDARRKEAEAKGLSQKYDGRCRDRGLTNQAGDAALRFKAPQEGETVVDDLIKGKIVFDNACRMI